MWNAATLLEWYLCGRDLNSLIDLNRITVDDFAVKAQRDFNSQLRFSGRGRADNRDDLARVRSAGILARIFGLIT